MKPGSRSKRQPDGRPIQHDRSTLTPVSPWGLAVFHGIARRRLARAFRAVRIVHACRANLPETEPLIVYLNHPSWWDPLVGFVVARFLFGKRRFYAPMDADALERYGLLRHLGMFPLHMESARGAAQFLRSGQAVLERGHILAVTPQGEFTDVRDRPVHLRPGLAALLARRQQRGQETVVLPIALEYTFWDQRLPEVLLQCGEPLRFAATDAPASRADLQSRLERTLATAQDELALLARKRDPAVFSAVLLGSSGSAGIFGMVEALRATFSRTAQAGDHQGRPPRVSS